MVFCSSGSINAPQAPQMRYLKLRCCIRTGERVPDHPRFPSQHPWFSSATFTPPSNGFSLSEEYSESRLVASSYRQTQKKMKEIDLKYFLIRVKGGPAENNLVPGVRHYRVLVALSLLEFDPWTSSVTSLTLSFLICNLRMIIIVATA